MPKTAAFFRSVEQHRACFISTVEEIFNVPFADIYFNCCCRRLFCLSRHKANIPFLMCEFHRENIYITFMAWPMGGRHVEIIK